MFSKYILFISIVNAANNLICVSTIFISKNNDGSFKGYLLVLVIFRNGLFYRAIIKEITKNTSSLHTNFRRKSALARKLKSGVLDAGWELTQKLLEGICSLTYLLNIAILLRPIYTRYNRLPVLYLKIKSVLCKNMILSVTPLLNNSGKLCLSKLKIENLRILIFLKLFQCAHK